MSDDTKKKPSIVLTKYTPYMVTDLENLYDSEGNRKDVRSVMSLCRCGKSKHKPCCDGAHVKEGINGEKKPGRVKDKLREVKGDDITIYDNRGVCSHDRSCVTDLPEVFIKGGRPWIKPNEGRVKDIVDTIEKCPSGALSYAIGHRKCTEQDREPAIKIAKNGPFMIEGNITLKDDQESVPESPEHYCLCRCGGSKNQPFCDGEHWHNGFEDPDN